MVSSSKTHGLRIIKKRIPSADIALIYYSTKTTWGLVVFAFFTILIFPITKKIIVWRAKRCQAKYINLFYIFARKRFVERLHAQGFQVCAWTVNRKKLITRMIKNKVDGIISNYPDRIRL